MRGRPVNPILHSRNCPICSHPERYEIERLVLSMSPSNPTLSLDAIADAFDVSSQDLRVHTLMHTPLSLDFSAESEAALVQNFQLKAKKSTTSDSEAGTTSGLPERSAVSDSNSAQPTGVLPLKERLTDKINLRESDMLLSNAVEMLSTVSTLGRRIKRFASDNSDGSDQRLAAFCSPALVNLYVSSSAELRKTIDAIRDLNASINGEHDNGSEGLKALAAALAGSNATAQQQGNDA